VDHYYNAIDSYNNIVATKMVPPPQDVPISSGKLDESPPTPDDDKFDEHDINHSRHVSFMARPKKKAIKGPPLSTENSNHNHREGQRRTHDNSNSNNMRRRRRADKRKGDRGKAADIVERSRNYCRERVANLQRHVAQDASVSSQCNDQYHIPPPDESNSILDAFFLLCSLALEDLASWVYAASFWMVLVLFLALYLLFVWIFVGFLLAADGYSTSQCIANDDILEEDVITRRHILEFAFALSWTTFTTVGYGRIAPPGDDDGCYAVRFICSIEAIMGMCFVSMCSGIFYAKLLRFIGSAPVTFSSTLCVQYGKGLSDTAYNTSDSSFSKGEDEEPDDERFCQSILGHKSFNPYPVIEFRIVNNRANCPPRKNEIWDAQVTGIVELSPENNDNSERLNSLPSEQHSTDQKISCDLKLSPSFHPYFCRTWFLRHILDESSPLLKEDVRRRLKERGPHKGWDGKLNNYKDIRKGLVEFTSIRIMMSGSSALSKGEVYAEKTYTYDDVFIGWKFIGVCFEDEDEPNSSQLFRRRRRSGASAEETKTRVDLSLLHDICPQKGANYEPMAADDAS